jgi:hypothetical protein
MGKWLANPDMTDRADGEKERRRSNIRLAVILGLIALGFYLLMIFLNPL